MKLKYASLKITSKDINEEKHSISAVFSTGDVDRHGEVVDQKSWLLDDFLANPVVLFGHDHSQPPIGKINNLGYNKEGNLAGEVQFAAEEYPFANVIWNLYKGGYMKAFSVGFAAGMVDIIDNQVILKENTLFEISTVAVPANAMALAKSKGIDCDALEAKYLEDGEKKEAEDDAPAEEIEEKKEEAEEEIPAVEPKKEEAVAEPETEEEKTLKKEAAISKMMEDAITSLKEGKVLSTKHRNMIQESINALEAILEADKPSDKSNKETIDKETKSANSTDAFIKVETPTVRVDVAKQSQNKTKLINKAIRALLVEKAKTL